MEENVLEMLEGAIKALLETMKTLKPGSNEYKVAASHLNELYKLRNDAVRVEQASQEAANSASMQEREMVLKEKEAKRQKIEQRIRLVVDFIGVTLPTAALVLVSLVGYDFEFKQSGYVGSNVLKDALKRFRLPGR